MRPGCHVPWSITSRWGWGVGRMWNAVGCPWHWLAPVPQASPLWSLVEEVSQYLADTSGLRGTQSSSLGSPIYWPWPETP